MKKIFLGLAALCLLSTASFAGNKKSKKAKKAKTEQKCPKQCPRTGGCGMMK